MSSAPGDDDALEAVRQLAEQLGVPSLSAALGGRDGSGLPDAVTPPAVIERARRHAALLERLGIDPSDLEASLSAWRFAMGPDVLFYRRPGDDWRRMPTRDEVDSALPRDNWARHGTTIDGVFPPVLLEAALGRVPPNPNGYAPQIHVVEIDPTAMLAGMAFSTIDDLATDDRIAWHVGENAVRSYADALASCGHAPLPRGVLSCPGSAAPSGPTPGAALAQADRRQQVAVAQLRPRVRHADQRRTAGWWAERYASIVRGESNLRALVITTRFSTFVRHSARDIADGLRRLGHEAEVLIDRDIHTKLGAGDLLETCDRVDPDLIILINHTRWQSAGMLPAGVPLLCWIQDAMGPLLCPIQPGQLSRRDYFAGHIFSRMFGDFGYPRERMMPCPVPASTSKFGGVEPRSDGFEAEMIFVSNHGPPPEELRESLREDLAEHDLPAELVDRLDVAARSIIEDPSLVVARTLKRACRDELAVLGVPTTPAAIAQVHSMVGLPIAERRFRYRMLGQAAEVCERNGWRLRLFGRGWDGSPEFSRYAAGLLEHGDELRDAYSGAVASLHGTTSRGVHQRVIECALAGGYTMISRTADLAHTLSIESARRELAPRLGDPTHRAAMLAAIERNDRLLAAPEGCQYRAWYESLCAEDGVEARIPICHRAAQLAPEGWLDDSYRKAPGRWSLDEPTDCTFRTAGQLERAVGALIADPADRRERILRVRAGIEAEFTYEAVLARLIDAIAQDLTIAAQPPA